MTLAEGGRPIEVPRTNVGAPPTSGVMAPPPRTHYEILGIARDADAVEVRRAWKVLVQVWHPDRFTGDMREEAERAAADINAAYHQLRDQSRRAAYDCTLAAEDARSRPSRSAQAPARRPRAGAATSTAAAPRGVDTAAPPAPATMADIAARASQDIIDTVRRSPRAMVITAAALAALVLGSLLIGSLTGPSLPAGTQVSSAQGISSAARSQDMPSLDAIVAESDAAAADDDDGLAIDAPMPGADPGRDELTPEDVLAAPVDAGEDAELDLPPPGPRVLPSRRNGKRVLRVLPTV